MKKAVLLQLCILFPLFLNAQLKPLTSQYILNPVIINPSAAGNSGALNVATFYRHQWTGIDGAPKTLSLAVDAPLSSSKVALGLLLTNDRIGVTRETSINTNYAFKIKMRNGVLSFGLGAGLITTNTAFSDLVAVDPGDDIFLVDSRIFVVPDFSYGMYYSGKRFFSGFSIPRLLGYEFDFNRNKYGLKSDPGKYEYMLNTGYSFDIGQRARFLPSVLVSYTPNDIFLYDINGHFSFFDKFWIGASYRNNRSLTGLFQFNINNQFKLAYSYDFDIGSLSRYSNGTHEIMLRYLFRYRVDAINPLIF